MASTDTISKPPIADRIPHDIYFGHADGEYRGDDIMSKDEAITINDPYFWLRDESKKDEKVQSYLKAENEYTEKTLLGDKHSKDLYDVIRKELISHTSHDGEPYKCLNGKQTDDKKIYCFGEYEKGDGHIKRSIKIIENDVEKDYLILDDNKYENETGYCKVKNYNISYNAKYCHFAVDTKGDEEFDIVIYDIEDPSNPVEIEHKIPGNLCGDHWMTNDEKYIIYIGLDDTLRMNSIYIYDIKSMTSKLLLMCDNVEEEVEAFLTEDSEMIIANLINFDYDEYYYLSLKDFDFELFEYDKSKGFTMIQKKIDGDHYDIDKIRNHFVIITDKLGSKEFIPMYCDITDNCCQKNWQPIDITNLYKKIGKQPGDIIYFYELKVVKDYVVFSIRHNGVKKLALCSYLPHHSSGKYESPFSGDWLTITPYDDTGYLDIDDTHYDSSTLIIAYTSLVTPRVIMQYNMTTGLKIITKRKVNNYDESNYKTYRLFAPSHDGKKIPITVVHRKEVNITHKNRIHLTCYGAYRESIETYFDKDIIPLLDRGYVYAIAHVRGGDYLGHQWYEDGIMFKKMNTFLDFKSVVEYFIKMKYSAPHLLSAEGASAGGLVMGYCITKIPHMFRSIIGEVPFLDILNTMSDPSLPLTTGEWKQWGNPNNRKEHNYIKKYSPYDNIVDNDYCNCYLTGGMYDNKVQYWEPAKFMAKLRHHHKSDKKRMHLLDINLESGHFDKSHRFLQCDDEAKKLLFILKNN